MVSDFKIKRKNAVSRNIFFKFGVIVLAAVMLLLLVADVKVYQKKRALAAQIKNLQAKVDDMEGKNEYLQKGIANAGNAAYMEKIAREEWDLQKPGEKVVSFITPQEQGVRHEAAPQTMLQLWFGWVSVSWSWLKNNL